jgi:hypothetical protein
VSEDAEIDAVVLWVDGSDPRHRAKLDKYLVALGRRPQSAAPTRFASLGEIDYCLTSLLRFAPFLRRVHVVTDDQVPPLMARAERGGAAVLKKLVRVDHRDIFAGHDDCLPTFSSLSIESVLHRIPGLSERFIYLNDDVMLIKPVVANDFFDSDRPVLRGRWKPAPDRRMARRIRALWRRWRGVDPALWRPGAADAQAMAARLAGIEGRYFEAAHAPFALRRSTLARYLDAHPDVLRKNIEYRLRDARQYATTALANHLELRDGQAVVAPEARLLYIKSASRRAHAKRLEQADHDPRLIFACVQSLDEASDATRALLLDWLDRTIGRSPPI